MTQNNLTEEALKAVFDKLSMKAEADTVRLKGEVNDLVENMLRDEIGRQYDSGQKERGAFDPMDFYRPSALGKTLSDGMCLWPCVTEHPEKGTSTGFEMMINHSNLLHVAYANMLKHRLHWYTVHIEAAVTIPMEAGLPDMTGHADLVLQGKGTSEYKAVYDFKTVRSNAFKYGDLVKDGHVLQVQAYMKGFDVKKGGLIYIDREGQNGYRFHPVERDDAAVVRAARRLYDVLTQSAVPEYKEPVIQIAKNGDITLKTPWQMSYCDMGGNCVCRKRAFGDLSVPERVHMGKVDMTTDEGWVPSKGKGASYLSGQVMKALEEALLGAS